MLRTRKTCPLPPSTSKSLKNDHASEMSKPKLSKYSLTAGARNCSWSISKVMMPVSSAPILLNNALIFFKWDSCYQRTHWPFESTEYTNLTWMSLLSKMFWTTAAWSFCAFSMADWQKTPCESVRVCRFWSELPQIDSAQAPIQVDHVHGWPQFQDLAIPLKQLLPLNKMRKHSENWTSMKLRNPPACYHVEDSEICEGYLTSTINMLELVTFSCAHGMWRRHLFQRPPYKKCLGSKNLRWDQQNNSRSRKNNAFHPQTVLGTCICAHGRTKNKYPSQLSSTALFRARAESNISKDTLQDCLYTPRPILAGLPAGQQRRKKGPVLYTGYQKHMALWVSSCLHFRISLFLCFFFPGSFVSCFLRFFMSSAFCSLVLQHCLSPLFVDAIFASSLVSSTLPSLASLLLQLLVSACPRFFVSFLSLFLRVLVSAFLRFFLSSSSTPHFVVF